MYGHELLIDDEGPAPSRSMLMKGSYLCGKLVGLSFKSPTWESAIADGLERAEVEVERTGAPIYVKFGAYVRREIGDAVVCDASGKPIISSVGVQLSSAAWDGDAQLVVRPRARA